MVTGIEFVSPVNVKVNANGKFYLDHAETNAESIKSIPVVMYNNFIDFEFIRTNMSKFKLSCHVVLVDHTGITEDARVALNELGVAVIVRVPLSEISLTEELSKSNVSYYLCDRVVILDNQSNTSPFKIAEVKESLSKLINVAQMDIGVCGSPFSYGNDACLNAIWCRRLMAKYTANTEVALPSANHESMECCGCIRRVVIDTDRKEPEIKRGGFQKKEETVLVDEDGNVIVPEVKVKPVKGVNNIRGMF